MRCAPSQDKRVSISSLALLFLWPFASLADEVRSSFTHKSPLTSVAGETSLDLPRDPEDPGVGGGIDATTYFRTRLMLNIEECTAAIDAAVERWVDGHDLLVTRSEHRPGDYLAHITRQDLEGLFEVTYRVSAKRERARATVYFYSNDGTRHEPLGLEQILDAFAIADFQDDLETALQCEAPA